MNYLVSNIEVPSLQVRAKKASVSEPEEKEEEEKKEETA